MATANRVAVLAWTIGLVPEPVILHPRLRGSIRHMLRMDQITVTRSTTTIDAEGDPIGGNTVIVADRGTLVSVSAQEQLTAQERGSRVDKALLVELGVNVMEGDRVYAKGVLYEAVSAENRRLHRRVLVRNLP